MYLVQRHHRYWAFHDIPPSLSGVNGLPKKRFSANLDTTSYEEAKIRAAHLEAQWLTAIRLARVGVDLQYDGLFNPRYSASDVGGIITAFKEAYRLASPEDRKRLSDAATITAGQLASDIDGALAGHDEPFGHADERSGRRAGHNVIKAATGGMVGLIDHLDEYLATLKDKSVDKSIDMKKRTITRFAVEFPYVADIQRVAVQKWVNAQSENGNAPKTISRHLTELRSYWKYLQSTNAAPEDYFPLEKLLIPRPAKDAKANQRRPFAPDDVVKLLAAAKARGDEQLADLIALGMWTGCRIEELCSLKADRVHLADGYIDITDAKTSAGWRQVPIHSKLMPVLKRLVEAGGSYVLAGLTNNKFGHKSNAIGKRFGRLKKDEGYPEPLVFHSIRKTVATLLENAGVPEGVAADILGHEKQTMTYGCYSGGTSLERKRDAIEKLKYL